MTSHLGKQEAVSSPFILAPELLFRGSAEESILENLPIKEKMSFTLVGAGGTVSFGIGGYLVGMWAGCGIINTAHRQCTSIDLLNPDETL
jgi:hypothetical protein